MKIAIFVIILVPSEAGQTVISLAEVLGADIIYRYRIYNTESFGPGKVSEQR